MLRHQQLRRLLPVLLALAVSLPAVLPVSAAESRVTFLPGCHTGYRFAASGSVTAALEKCIGAISTAPATSRIWVDGRGVHHAISAGIWAGYLVPESPRSYLPGLVGSRPYPPGERRSFPIGTYQGWLFDPTYTSATAASRVFLGRASGAPVTRQAVINGQPYLEIGAGIWAGQWIRASGASASSGPRMEYGPNAPGCRVADVLTAFRSYPDWWRTLLDTNLMVAKGYAPPDIVDSKSAGMNGGYPIRRLMAADLKAMAAAARAVGAPIQVVSGYRSYATQVTTFNHWVSVGGYQQALKTSARPGHSEHQLGTALDVTSLGGAAPWTYADWGTTKAGAWMRANAWRYGFVMSYPKGAEATTCYSYEPWHFRYVGRAMAANVTASGLPLRTYLWRMGSGA